MNGVLELLFPPRCPGCRELLEGPGPFCRPCRDSCVEVPRPCCPRCAEPECGGLCPHCRARPPGFERAVVPFLHGGAVAEAIHRFKYGDAPQLAVPLAALALPRVAEQLAWATLLAPVSLHARRLKGRGYDQALLLARELGRLAGRAVAPRAVRRVRHTAPQVGRDRAGRERNVLDAFIAAPVGVEGQRIVLVDDVLTTGATASAAARVLLEAGAAAVRVVAVARASA